jgi:Smg protein
MQERILEIIVYLLNELQQERKGLDKIDLTRDLLVNGYTEGEVNLAFSWIFNHLKSTPQNRIDSDIDYTDQFEDYPEFERLIISPDAYGFLLKLIQLGVIKENDIEMFIERAIAYGKDDISVDDLKSIVATILFGLDNRSSFNGYPFFQGDTTIQ